MSGGADFYRRLPAVASFDEATAAVHHADLPDDWWVVIADVRGSTRAIAAGAYKDVNTVGVACIAAVTNIDRELDLPYLFGGDGATFAIPDSLREAVLPALRAAQKLAREGFGLNLRTGLVRAASLRADGYVLRIGKLRLSEWVTQPVLSGSGWSEAERRVKTPGAAAVISVEEAGGPAAASFEGFECRWQTVPAFKGHKLALLVAARSMESELSHAVYQDVLERIRAIYGDEAQHHPLRTASLRMSFSPRALSHEWRVRSLHQGWRARCGYFARLLFLNAAGSWLFARGVDTEATRWTRYLPDFVANSDYRKFDGMLRMVIDGSEQQAAQLQAWLEQEYRAKRLVYGLRKSRRALVTCIVRDYNGDHQHFVDGSDGGYAMAARELKRRMIESSESTTREESA